VLDETVELTVFTYKFPDHHHTRGRAAWSKGARDITLDSSVFGGRCQCDVRLNREGFESDNDNILACQSLYKLFVGVDKLEGNDGNASALDFLDYRFVD
jgi:hypothetical protein